MLKREFLSTKNLHLSYNQTVYTNTSTPNQKKKKEKRNYTGTFDTKLCLLQIIKSFNGTSFWL